jgi:hypothetical protein
MIIEPSISSELLLTGSSLGTDVEDSAGDEVVVAVVAGVAAVVAGVAAVVAGVALVAAGVGAVGACVLGIAGSA